MNSSSTISFIVLSVALVVAGFLIGDMHRKAKAFDKAVTVKGLSEREVDADLAVWPMQISIVGNDLNGIKVSLEDQKKEVQSFFDQLGFTEEEVDMGVTTILDRKSSTYDRNDYAEYRYVANSDITVRTEDLEKIKRAQNKSLDLIAKGILLNSKNTWRPISYTFSGLNDIKPEMIEEATKKAREVAEKFAKDSDSEVGGIKKANQGLFTITDRDENTPEIKIVRVVTTIDYFLKD